MFKILLAQVFWKTFNFQKFSATHLKIYLTDIENIDCKKNLNKFIQPESVSNELREEKELRQKISCSLNKI